MCVDTAGSIPRAAFYSGSSIGRAMVSKTVGCRFKACPERHAMYSRGTAVQSIAGHLAAKVPDAAAPARFTPVRQTECMGAAYFFLISLPFGFPGGFFARFYRRMGDRAQGRQNGVQWLAVGAR